MGPVSKWRGPHSEVPWLYCFLCLFGFTGRLPLHFYFDRAEPMQYG
jgi:hypothetical protein